MLQCFEQGNAVHFRWTMFCITVYVPIILSIFVHTSVYFLWILFCKVFDTAILYISFTVQFKLVLRIVHTLNINTWLTLQCSVEFLLLWWSLRRPARAPTYCTVGTYHAFRRIGYEQYSWSWETVPWDQSLWGEDQFRREGHRARWGLGHWNLTISDRDIRDLISYSQLVSAGNSHLFSLFSERNVPPSGADSQAFFPQLQVVKRTVFHEIWVFQNS